MNLLNNGISGMKKTTVRSKISPMPGWIFRKFCRLLQVIVKIQW